MRFLTGCSYGCRPPNGVYGLDMMLACNDPGCESIEVAPRPAFPDKPPPAFVPIRAKYYLGVSQRVVRFLRLPVQSINLAMREICPDCGTLTIHLI